MAGPKTDKTGQIIKPKSPKILITMLQDLSPEFNKVLPRHLPIDRMMRIVQTALRITPKLAACTPTSFFGSIMQCAQLGLETNTLLGEAYLVPYGDQCQLILGYQGMIELSRRSGQLDIIYACLVYEGDEFNYTLGLKRNIDHKPSRNPERFNETITDAYSVAYMLNGSYLFTVLSRAEIEARRKRSPAANRGPWVTDYAAMCQKTTIRAIYKWLPRSGEINRALALDTVIENAQPQSNAYDDKVRNVLDEVGLLPEDTQQTATEPSQGPEPTFVDNTPTTADTEEQLYARVTPDDFTSKDCDEDLSSREHING